MVWMTRASTSASHAIALVDLGWGQMHAYGDYGTELLIYGPRSDVELDIVLSIIEESLAFARG